MSKLKVGDTVVVLAGKDKDKTGTVIRFVRKTNRLVVEGVNMIKKHIRPNPQKGTKGGIVEREASIHASNVAIYNDKTNKKDKVAYQINDGKKVRVYRSSGEAIDA